MHITLHQFTIHFCRNQFKCASSQVCLSDWLSQGNEGVWSSLTCLLLEVIELSISAPDIIEALWMCRIRQSSTSEVLKWKKVGIIDQSHTNSHTHRDRALSVLQQSSWLSGSVRTRNLKREVSPCTQLRLPSGEVCWSQEVGLVC